MLTLLMSNFWREHARANLPGGLAAPLLVDESAGCTVWDRGTSRSSGEPVELRANGEIEAAGSRCWKGGGSGEERSDCTPASSPFASVPPFAPEAAPAATAGSAAMRLQRRSAVMALQPSTRPRVREVGNPATLVIAPRFLHNNSSMAPNPSRLPRSAGVPFQYRRSPKGYSCVARAGRRE